MELAEAQKSKQADQELAANFRLLDPAHPVKYDFALFGERVA